MDKYEYNLKLEEIDKLVDQGEYTEAAALADTIEWKRVRNVRTLCLISEIYEAADRLEDSKKLLLRAYRRSPVGRTVLYRLVEVTTALAQYDEALEYYSEYIQAAPHDNTRYILKYMIYRGRGSAPEELISILEEYLGQEYTEKWAFELARLYQQTGQMQKCFATCDDLVLWFHSGKYVLKALELKSRFTSLTMKQQQIYEECLQEAAMESYAAAQAEEQKNAEAESAEAEAPAEIQETPAEAEVKQEVPEDPTENIKAETITPETIITESIMAETEREIADEVAATKAELEQVAEAEETPSEEAVLSKEHASLLEGVQNVVNRTLEASQEEAEKEIASVSEEKSEETEAPAEEEPAVTEVQAAEVPAAEVAEDEAAAEEAAEKAAEDFQIGLAKNMREILSGVVRHSEDDDEDLQNNVMDNRIHKVAKLQMPEARQTTVSKLSIDDILLSMGDKGRKIAEDMKQREAEEQKAREEEAARLAEEEQKRAEAEAQLKAEQEAAEEAAREALEAEIDSRGKSISEVAEDELTDDQKEALTYTNHPEKLLRNKGSLPTYAEKKEIELPDEVPVPEEFEPELKEENTDADILSEKTVKIPTKEVARARAQMPLEEETPEENPAKTSEINAEEVKEELKEAAKAEESEELVEEGFPEYEDEEEDVDYIDEEYPNEYYGEEVEVQEFSADDMPEAGQEEPEEEIEEELEPEEEYDENRLYIPDHLRNLFRGFTSVRGLEDQIANAIIQAQSKGTDRTSRTGNILIFGEHGSGKTSLAVNLAKAIAQDKGSQIMKMAKIYATDLNRKDIAATVAKIAGGTLIIEEAGDLEDNIVDQLTTAMEFRTDGLIVILEDEQQYIHDLLMRHPRFTMKFTAQIYIPVYTAEELSAFGQNHAQDRDCIIGEEALVALQNKISAQAESGTAVTVTDVIEMVEKAIHKANKFFRKIGSGKKRYDDNNFVILLPKDFK